MPIGRHAQQWFVHVYYRSICVYVVWMGGAGGVGDGLPMVRVGWEELGGLGMGCRVSV